MWAWRKVMAAYPRVYDSHHLQADCQEPGSAPKPYIRSIIEYGLAFTFHRIVRVIPGRTYIGAYRCASQPTALSSSTAATQLSAAADPQYSQPGTHLGEVWFLGLGD